MPDADDHRRRRRASARSSAASSVVAPVSKRSGADAEPLQRLGAACRRRGRRRTTTSRAAAQRLGRRRGRPSSAASLTTTTSGCSPAASRASAPRSDADQHRVLLAEEAPEAGQLAAVVGPGTTTTTGRPAMRVAVRGSAPAVQQQVLLATEELGAVVGEALQLGGQPAAGLVHLVRRPSSRSSTRPEATASSPT